MSTKLPTVGLLFSLAGSMMGKEAYVDPGDRRFNWKEIAYQEVTFEGTTRGVQGGQVAFTLALRLGMVPANKYLTDNGLRQRNVLGWYPGEITTIDRVSLRIDKTIVSLGMDKMKDVVNPKVESIRVDVFDDQFLITFDGPDAAESYRCQLHADKRGFRRRVTQSWIGGKGFSASRVVHL